jgi:hypothetical protein
MACSDSEVFPDVQIPSLDSLIPSHMVWNILDVMQRRERGTLGKVGRCSTSDATCSTGVALRLPPGFDSWNRAVMVDFMIGLASSLNLTGYTLHLAASVADRYMSYQEGPISAERMHVIGATCLKVADVFAEQSKEYYKQENTVEYAEASMHSTSPAQMLSCEKDVLFKVDFDLRLPTVHWFLQCYLAYSHFTANDTTAKTCFFIADLTLLDYDLLIYGPSMRAQCCVVLAAFLVQHALADKKDSPHDERRDPCALHKSNAGKSEQRLMLPYLAHWDEHVRNSICRRNTAVDAAMCLQAVVRTLVVNRREWKSAKLVAVENKHASNIRALNYPEMFPVSKLVRYMIPDCQRGLIPE